MKGCLTVMLAAALPAWAGFPEPVQQIALSYGQRSVTVVYRTDGSAVTKVKPLCDCTKTTVRGSELTAVVDVSNFDADVEKQIEATTSDGKVTRLTMKFRVPPPVVFSENPITWKLGGPAETRRLQITLPKGSPITAVEQAGLTGHDFDYRTEKVKEGREYAVYITPKSTAKSCMNRLVLRLRSADPRYVQRVIYLRVKK